MANAFEEEAEEENLPWSSLAPTLARAFDTLSNLLSSPIPPPSIFIHSPNNPSLTLTLVRSILASVNDRDKYSPDRPGSGSIQSLLPNSASLDLTEIHSPRLLYDRVLNTLAGWEAAWVDDGDGGGHVENWDGKLEGLSLCSREDSFGGSGRPRKRRRLVDGTTETDIDRPALRWDRETWDSQSLNRGVLGRKKNESLDTFFDGLRTIAKLGSATGHGHSGNHQEVRPKFLVFSNAERLGSMGAEASAGGAAHGAAGMGGGSGEDGAFMSAMMRVGEFTTLPYTSILISTLPWYKLRPLRGATEPFVIEIPPLKREDCVGLLGHSFTRWLGQSTIDSSAINDPEKDPAEAPLSSEAEINLYKDLVSLVHQTCEPYIGGELEDLEYLCDFSTPPQTGKMTLWQKWRGWVTSGEVQARDTARLSSLLKPSLAAAIERFGNLRWLDVPTEQDTKAGASAFTGMISPHQTPASSPSKIRALRSTADSSPGSPSSSQVTGYSNSNGPTSTSLVSALTTVSKYLLVAAYLASYNPQRTDVRMFAIEEDERRRRGKRSRKGVSKRVGKRQERQQLLGPKAFPIERLLAIYESILPPLEKDRRLGHIVDVLSQVATLISLRLLLRASTAAVAAEKLDGVKLKCNIEWEIAEDIARSLKFALRERTWEIES